MLIFFSKLLASAKKYFLFALGLLLILGVIWYGYKKIQSQKIEIKRLDQNLVNANFDIIKSKTKNDKLQYTVSSLTLKNNEFEKVNKVMFDDLTSMNLKVKNLQSASNIEFKYVKTIDTVWGQATIDTNLYAINWKDSWVDLSGILNLNKKTSTGKLRPLIQNLKLTQKDSLLIASEIKYKRVWLFWKKPISIDIHIKSQSPYFDLDRLQTYQLIK